jgi:3-oxoadipyl-CoA thiolase
MEEVLVLDAIRTPIGRHGGALAAVRPDDLAAHLIAAMLKRTGVEPGSIDDVVLGCANQAGEDNRNVGRMAALVAGLPYSVPGVTVNRLCASGLEAVQHAARAIAVGEAELVLAGGVESMSRAPLVLPKPERPFATGHRTVYDTTLGWRFPNPKLEARFPLEQMGETAENLAERYKIGREEQDTFAFASHQKALAAVSAGRFDAEIVPVPVPGGKGGAFELRLDEGPRPDTSLEKLARLKPAFRAGGTVTAGSSSTLNDGAALLLLGTRRKAEELGLGPMARVVASAVAGVDPTLMGIGPVPAARLALQRAGLGLGQVDLFELNEAFAAQVLAVQRELDVAPERLNVKGGAIALGHPLGCSGARIAVTLLHELRRRGARYGLASLCVGVGQGSATLFEAL